VDDIGLHFIHERGKGSNPFPIILTHGYPDSFYPGKSTVRRSFRVSAVNIEIAQRIAGQTVQRPPGFMIDPGTG
jgi:Epoxide hydrolase N terminus